MGREFWVKYDLYKKIKDITAPKKLIGQQRKNFLDAFFGRASLAEPWGTLDNLTRLFLLAQLLVSSENVEVNKGKKVKVKDYARTGALQQGEISGLLYWYYCNNKFQCRKENLKFTNPNGPFQKTLEKHLRELQTLNLLPSLPNLSIFPRGSWAIQIKFKLKKPYISKDDTEFYIIDNPIKKEWVFKVPYVAPSQWKGALRTAMVRQLVEWWNNLPEDKRNSKGFATRRFSLVLLFGSEKGEEPGTIKGLARYLDNVGGQTAAQEFRNLLRKYFSVRENEPIPHLSGSLHFFPTYFDRIGLEVINPHPRDTGAGKQPIYFECVPAGTEGVFTVLYVPQSGIDEKTSKKTLKAVAQGIKAMLTEYGFGAKTSSGYGVAELSYTSQKSIIVEPKEYESIVSKIWED